MKKLLSMFFLFSAFTGLAFAQTTTTATASSTTEISAGLTPESSFYFLDKITEALQELFTFTPDAKVKLQLHFAAERVAEAKAMLAVQGDHTKGLDVIQAGIVENVQKTADVIKQEKAAGHDVTGLAKEANDQLDSEESDLNKTLAETHKDVVDKKIEETKKLLEEAKATKDEAKISDAEQSLQENQQIAQDLKTKREEIQKSFHDEKRVIEDEMSADDQKADQVNSENENEDATSSVEIRTTEDGNKSSLDVQVQNSNSEGGKDQRDNEENR